MSDLLVVGAGVLGMLVARTWRQSTPGARVTLKFRTEKAERRAELEREGFSVISGEGGEACSAPLVVFCAPPTGNTHYAEDIKFTLASHWTADSPGSVMVFTSSGSVFRENSGGQVDELSATVETERATALLAGEEAVVGGGGCVVRLGGLYTLTSGPHNYWGRGGQFSAKPGGLINLLHYEDAAEAVVRGLQQPDKVRGQRFLVSDGTPVSRQEIVSAAGVADRVQFTGGDDIDGKRYDTTKIRTSLGWQPTYASIREFYKSVK